MASDGPWRTYEICSGDISSARSLILDSSSGIGRRVSLVFAAFATLADLDLSFVVDNDAVSCGQQSQYGRCVVYRPPGAMVVFVRGSIGFGRKVWKIADG